MNLREIAQAAIARSMPRDEECDGYGGELPNSADGWFCDKCAYVGRWGENGPHDYSPPAAEVVWPADRALAALDVVDLAKKIAQRVCEAGVWYGEFTTDPKCLDVDYNEVEPPYIRCATCEMRAALAKWNALP